MSEQRNEKGKVVIVSGPSGVGKTTICREVVKRLDNASLSVSVTTRPKTEREVDGGDYWFVTKEEFQQRIEKGQFLEYAEVFGNMYGTPKNKVDEALQADKTVILEIDVQGARQVEAFYPEAVMIFILPPSQRELVERIQNRGRDEAQATEERLGVAGTEIAAGWQYYRNMVINDNLQQAVDEVIQIIRGGESDSTV